MIVRIDPLEILDECRWCAHPITAHLTFSGDWDECEVCGCVRAMEFAEFYARLVQGC